MRLLYQMALTAAFAAALAAGWSWWESRENVAKSAITPIRPLSKALVLVEPLSLVEDQVVVQAVGTGEALKSASIYPKADGEVKEVLFEAGRRVATGDILLRLENRHERLAVRLAQVAEREARRQVQRLEKLVPSGAVPLARLQTAQAEHESALVRVEQASAALEDRIVAAPFDGVIGMTAADVGDRVTEDDLIAMLDDRSYIDVEFELPEDYADRLGSGLVVSLRSWSSPDLLLRGELIETDSRMNAQTRSLRVKARVANPEDRIRPGMSFEVSLTLPGRRYPAVREVAVLWSRDGAYLWRIAEDRAEKVFVRIVRRNKGLILVDGPLAAGDTIVVEGVQGLRDGQAVEVRPFASTTGPKTAGGNS